MNRLVALPRRGRDEIVADLWLGMLDVPMVLLALYLARLTELETSE